MPLFRRLLRLPALVMLATALTQPAFAQAPFDVKPGDHISIIGNTLADRMQHDGWLEAYFYSRFPKHDLVFRNLGFAADEVNPSLRLRSANFGSPDKWLTDTKTDVVFAFFGYNESFAGEAGLAKFKSELEDFITKTLKQKYNGNSAPRLVLFAPIAQEELKDPNLPNPTENNRRLALYTKTMAEVAKANNVPFVDLFTASQAAYTKIQQPLTINGVHLNEQGNEEIARAIDKSLFANQPEPKRDTEQLEKIRRAVLDKNFYWHNRYRTVDGYSIYGGRSSLKFVGGQTNFVVMQREMEILDVMTANRDKRIWAVAQGKDLKVDDSNTPDFIPVQTNKPGPLPGGKHLFLDPKSAIDKMTVTKGYKVNLFASEKEFPQLVNPVQMSFDPKGRLWVATWPTYPHWKPKEPMNDQILILEDTDGDGVADKCSVFADGLHCVTGFEFYNGGVLVAMAPDVFFLKDTDGDGKADLKVRVLSGIDSADTHHTSNSFVLDPGGALYFQEGTFHHTQVESPWGPAARCVNAGVFRYEPRSQKFDVYVAHGFANPHGHVFDRWGQDIVVDGTGAVPFHGTLFSGQVDYPQRHGRPPQVYKQKTRPCPGMEVLSSRHFPEDKQGNLLVGNVIGFQGILQYKMKDQGASLGATEAEPILSSTDPNFRPSDLRIGPDGAIYFLDWHNPIIGHMQHNLRDPSRDREHGRIYRVTYEGRDLLKPARIAGEPIEKLLDLLKEPEDRVRYRARIELGGRPTAEVIAALGKWTEKLDPKDSEYEHHMLEALWMHQYHNVVNADLLKRMLRSPNFRARAAATRVLCYWRDRVSNPIDLLRVQINDSQPAVRLQAIRALSFFGSESALSTALELLAHPTDEYLNFVFNETLNTLERRVAGGSKIDRKNIAVSLLAMLDKGKVSEDRKRALVDTIVRHGTEKELKVIWDRAISSDGFSPALRRKAVELLAEAATTRKVQPKVDWAAFEKLLGAADGRLLPEVIQLAAAWKLKDSLGELRRIARLEQAGPEARYAALDALASFRDSATLEALATKPNPAAIRFRAAAGLAQIDVNAGSVAAAQALADASEKDDPSPLVEAFLVRKDGSDKLAVALEKQKLSIDTAKRVLRAMYLAGRNDAKLSDVVSRYAGLKTSPKPPTTEEVKQYVQEALAKGDPHRGELVFRRADLGCIKCHSINKAGGNIGPDLGPIGGSSPVDYIVTSILDPNLSIKEEYLTKTVVTASGQVLTGIVAERSKNQLILKDATGKLVKIATSDVEEERNGKSLMPEGVTRILTQAELLDLIRFVSELGKQGGPFPPNKAITVQRWKKLREVPAELREGIPNRDLVRDALLNAGSEAWDLAFARVNGSLPVEEYRKPGQPGVFYFQGEIHVLQPGKLEFLVESKDAITLWIDEDAFEKQNQVTVPLAAGRHRITIRAPVLSTTAADLRLEIRKPADSKALFEFPHE